MHSSLPPFDVIDQPCSLIERTRGSRTGFLDLEGTDHPGHRIQSDAAKPQLSSSSSITCSLRHTSRAVLHGPVHDNPQPEASNTQAHLIREAHRHGSLRTTGPKFGKTPTARWTSSYTKKHPPSTSPQRTCKAAGQYQRQGRHLPRIASNISAYHHRARAYITTSHIPSTTTLT